MSSKQLLICMLALVSGLKLQSIVAQTPHDAGTFPARPNRRGTSAVRSRSPVLSSAVQISPSKLGLNSTSISGGDNFIDLQGFDLRSLIAHLSRISAHRIDLPASLDLTKRYDAFLSLPTPASEASLNAVILQAIQDRFHLAPARVSRPTDVYVVSAVGTPPASYRAAPATTDKDSVVTDSSFAFRAVSYPGQAPITAQPGIEDITSLSIANASLEAFCETLEGEVDRPVVNETHLRGAFNFNLTSTNSIQNDLLDQLQSKMNLVIQPAKRPIEFLVFRLAGGALTQGSEAVFVRRSNAKQPQEATDWNSWLSASCKIEQGVIPPDLCAKSNPPGQRQEPSARALTNPASRQ